MRLEVVDTHVHLDVAPLDESAWRAAHDRGVTAAITMGVSPSQWPTVIRLSRQLEGVHHALGIHPQAIPELDDAALDTALDALPDLVESTGAIAIGECGLDGPSGDIDRQLRALRAHLAIAKTLKKPVCLHVFKMHGPMVDLLREIGPLDAGGVVHSYSGSAELVKRYVDANLCVSFAGAITRSNAKKPLLACVAVPEARLLLETDAPFQPTGSDARDRKFGEPADIFSSLETIARARGTTMEKLAEVTTANAKRVFGSRLP